MTDITAGEKQRGLHRRRRVGLPLSARAVNGGEVKVQTLFMAILGSNNTGRVRWCIGTAIYGPTAMRARMKIDRPQGAGADSWSALNKSHEPLFRKHISAHEIPLSYERGWAYITQTSSATRSLDPLSWCALDCCHQRPAEPVRLSTSSYWPGSGNSLATSRALASSLIKTTDRRVVLRKGAHCLGGKTNPTRLSKS